MTNEQTRDISARCNEALKETQRLCFATRASELQEDAANRLKDLRGRVSKSKTQAVKSFQDDAANLLLALEELLDSYVEELCMWVALKADRMGDAWDHLVEAQMSVGRALATHPSVGNFEGRAQKLSAVERIVFPPMTFMSFGGIIKNAQCSICKLDYDACDHVAGRAYMGEHCARILTEIKLQEVSIVDDPSNKHARVVSFVDGGVSRDCLTLREVEAQPEVD